MTRLVFYVQGSAPEPYKIVIERTGDQIRASCGCQGAKNGQLCKHRLALFEGKPINIIGGDVDQIGEISTLISGTTLQKAFIALKDVEAEKSVVESKIKKAKKTILKEMLG